MPRYHYQLLNVFAVDGQPLSGNPLCVFEDARGLSDAQMQALALQFNLSETTFILPAESTGDSASDSSGTTQAHALVRIFTPTFEMPFAGHPTLGTAAVVQALQPDAGLSALNLQMRAGIIPVTRQGDRWSLTANEPTWRPAEASPAQLAAMLGLDIADLAEPALWVNTGSEQLVIPLRSADAVARCRPDAGLLQQYASLNAFRYLAYVWAVDEPATSVDGARRISARFFFAKGNAVLEDPATGSAAANLGGWWLATEGRLPFSAHIAQGQAVGRASHLGLAVDGNGRIQVSGRVVMLGRGSIEW